MNKKTKAWRAKINGLSLAGLQWRARSGPDSTPHAAPILALHGWLDNSASMAPLLEALDPKAGALALDLPGHGLSAHIQRDQHAPFVDYVDHVLAVIENQNWDAVDLIGHSMGGAIAVLLAASFPERVRKLVLIDSLGPIAADAARFSADLRAGILARRRVWEKKLPTYQTVEAAVQARLGAMGIGERAVRAIATRGLKRVSDQYTWRTDPRLTTPSPTRFNEVQILQAISEIKAPTLLLLADPRTSFLNSEIMARRLEAFSSADIVAVPGNHHLHLDFLELVIGPAQRFLAR